MQLTETLAQAVAWFCQIRPRKHTDNSSCRWEKTERFTCWIAGVWGRIATRIHQATARAIRKSSRNFLTRSMACGERPPTGMELSISAALRLAGRAALA